MVKCLYCTKEFNPSNPLGKYCSVICSNKSRRKRTKVPCDNCGLMIEKLTSRIKRDKHNFCSHSCRNKLILTRKISDLVNREQIKKRILTERKYECEICGYNVIVELHHKDGNKNNNNKTNLILLCPNHHSEVHAGILNL